MTDLDLLPIDLQQLLQLFSSLPDVRFPELEPSGLQVAVARLLGYRWPDQEPDDFGELADDDGIVALPSVRGETPAAERLRTEAATRLTAYTRKHLINSPFAEPNRHFVFQHGTSSLYEALFRRRHCE